MRPAATAAFLGDPAFWHQRAAHASQAGDTRSALACYERLLAVAPADIEAHFYTGYHLYLDGELASAEASYRRALALDPGHADAAWCLAMLRWLKGDLQGAWRTYERRLGRRGFALPARIAAKPAWRGEMVPDETLLLWAEQGHGDTIQFIRYAALAKQRVGRLVVACQSALKRLLSTQSHLADLVVGDGDPVPAFDRQASIMSLPVIFDTRIGTIPAACPYILSPPPDASLVSGGLFNVGLVWSGSPHNQPMNRYRAMPFTDLLPLLGMDGVRFHSLQVGPAAQAEAAPFVSGGRLGDLASRLTDFAEAARFLHAMDLVVTVDTSVPHLAGAMGKPTFLMLAKTPDYRWFLSGDRSPWYPSLRLFRQSTAGVWRDVVEAVSVALRQQLAERKA